MRLLYAQHPAGALPRRSGNVTGDSGIVTTDSGRSQKSVTIDQNERSRCAGITGHDGPESVVTMGRNTQLILESLIAHQNSIAQKIVDI